MVWAVPILHTWALWAGSVTLVTAQEFCPVYYFIWAYTVVLHALTLTSRMFLCALGSSSVTICGSLYLCIEPFKKLTYTVSIVLHCSVLGAWVSEQQSSIPVRSVLFIVFGQYSVCVCVCVGSFVVSHCDDVLVLHSENSSGCSPVRQSPFRYHLRSRYNI